MADCTSIADCGAYAQLSNRYLREFLDMKCAPDMLALRVWPRNRADKEITEAFGAYNAVRKYLRDDFSLQNPDVRVVCVGDGRTPRAAVTFAFRTAWTAHSVDPQLKTLYHRGLRPMRLEMHHKRIEECRFDWPNPTVIVACHSHAPLQAAIDACCGAVRLAVVAIPCCVEQHVPGIPADVVYDDKGIMSLKRRVLVWRDVRRKPCKKCLPPLERSQCFCSSQSAPAMHG